MNFDWLFNLFKKNKINFLITKDLGVEEFLKDKLKKEKKEGVIDLSSELQVFILDKTKQYCTKKDMQEYLKSNLVSMGIYKDEKYDCDDFALHLWDKVRTDYPLLAFGFVLSSKHAFNIFIDNETNIWIIEPQDDKLMTVSESQKKDLYKNLKLIVM